MKQKQKAFSTIWILVIVVIFAGAGFLVWQKLGAPDEETEPAEQTEPVDETANWKIYHNDEYELEVGYPEQWNLAENNLRRDSSDPGLTQWGRSDDWCVGFDVGMNIVIEGEKTNIIVYIFLNNAYAYKKSCEEKGGDYCRYDKENPVLFFDGIKIYKPIAISYDWFVEGQDKFIGVNFGRNIPEGMGIPDHLGPDLRKELNDLYTEILSTFRFVD